MARTPPPSTPWQSLSLSFLLSETTRSGRGTAISTLVGSEHFISVQFISVQPELVGTAVDYTLVLDSSPHCLSHGLCPVTFCLTNGTERQ